MLALRNDSLSFYLSITDAVGAEVVAIRLQILLVVGGPEDSLPWWRQIILAVHPIGRDVPPNCLEILEEHHEAHDEKHHHKG